MTSSTHDVTSMNGFFVDLASPGRDDSGHHDGPFHRKFDRTGLPSSGPVVHPPRCRCRRALSTSLRRPQISACEADFSSVETAIVTYYSDNGKPPGAGTTWATSNPTARHHAVVAIGGTVLHACLERTVLTVTPDAPASTDSIGTKTPRTSCYAA